MNNRDTYEYLTYFILSIEHNKSQFNKLTRAYTVAQQLLPKYARARVF